MEKEFTISFDTFIGILSSAYVYYKKLKSSQSLGYNEVWESEVWESIVLDKLEEFLTKSPSNEFKIIGK